MSDDPPSLRSAVDAEYVCVGVSEANDDHSVGAEDEGAAVSTDVASAYVGTDDCHSPL